MTFITGDQLGRLLNDYGPVVAFLALLVFSITVLILLWKPVSKFVTATNTILELPKRMDEQDALTAAGQAKTEEVHRALETHLKEGEGYITKLTDVERQVHAVLQQQQDIVHEVKPNSGSSMKDALNRIEQQVLPALAEQMKNLSADAVRQSGRVNRRADDQDRSAAVESKPAPRPRSRRKAADSTEEP